MMRYDIEETAVYIQVRTVVWEDGAARPLLPDQRTLVRVDDHQVLEIGGPTPSCSLPHDEIPVH
jgi:hypothetical protein